MIETIQLIVYSRENCHLCDQAIALLNNYLRNKQHIKLEIRDIDTRDEWEQRYCFSVPVLARREGSELCWPFGREEVEDFVRK